MSRVLREMERRDVTLRDVAALEVFGGAGDLHVKDYASRVASMEIWEIDEGLGKQLRQKFPNAAVRITDAYEEIRRPPANKFGLIVVDNGISVQGGHCEHFDLFPYILERAADRSVLVLDVIPRLEPTAAKDYPYLFNDLQLRQRAAFYETDRPEEISIDQMVATYDRWLRAHGFALDWSASFRRTFIHYLVLGIARRASCSALLLAMVA